VLKEIKHHKDMRYDIVNIKTGKVVRSAKTYREICGRYAELAIQERIAGREVKDGYRIDYNV